VLRVERILWAMMLSSVIVLFGVAQMQPPGKQDGSSLEFVFPALALMQVALSFIIPRLAMAQAKDLATARRSRLVLALAFCEAAALMGFVLYITTGWPYSWTLFLLGGLAMILHFPRGE